jgi:signal transduction histidine kinase
VSAPALRPRALLRTLGPATVCAAAAIGVVTAAGDGGGSATPLAIAGLLMLSGLAASALLLSGFLREVDRDAAAILRYVSEVGKGDTGTPPPPVARADVIGALSGAVVASFEPLRSSVADLTNARKVLLDRNAAQATELARLTQELKKRATELAAADRSREDFLTNVSHELRTPLNSIIGLTQLIRDGATETPQETASFLDEVLVSARHLLHLINDVLELTKIDSGKMVLDLADVDAPSVVEEVRQIVDPLALKKGLQLSIDVAPDLPPASADRLRLRQVLVNLAENGVKFTEKGSVTLRVRTSDGKRKLLFEVDDTGIGIPPQKRAVVFERFIQAEAGTTRRFGGAGLGLPICRLLVEALRGTIAIENGPGGIGTRVWFTIPVPRMEGR